VAERDSNFLFAQYMLGVGGVVSRQYDRAAARFEKVVRAQPENMEVLIKLSEAYELAGKNDKAIEWYRVIIQKVGDPAMKVEIEKRIAQLQQQGK
jgi:lipopolysaccharide biosynthesis regulator YciM